MTTDFNSVVAFNVIKYRVSLELTIVQIFSSFLLLLVEGLDPIAPSIFQTLNIFPCPMRYSSSIINDTKLVLSYPELLYFLIKHAIPVHFQELLVANSLRLHVAFSVTLSEVLWHLLAFTLMLFVVCLNHLNAPCGRDTDVLAIVEAVTVEGVLAVSDPDFHRYSCHIIFVGNVAFKILGLLAFYRLFMCSFAAAALGIFVDISIVLLL